MPQEQAIRQDLQRHRESSAQTLADLADREEQLEQEVARLLAGTDERERSLLTTQGDELVAIVGVALRDLGFEVEEMDPVWPAGQRREDLRVSDSDDLTWVAIVEVRGYTGGGQVNDLLRIGRFQNRYLQDEGAEPTRSWYIVNQFKDLDPDERPALLASSPDEVATFAESGGLAVDTRTLFTVWMEVRYEQISRERARATLRAATGVLVYPAIGLSAAPSSESHRGSE